MIFLSITFFIKKAIDKLLLTYFVDNLLEGKQINILISNTTSYLKVKSFSSEEFFKILLKTVTII